MNVLLPSGSAESLAGIGRKSRRDTEGLAAVKKVSLE